MRPLSRVHDSESNTRSEEQMEILYFNYSAENIDGDISGSESEVQVEQMACDEDTSRGAKAVIDGVIEQKDEDIAVDCVSVTMNATVEEDRGSNGVSVAEGIDGVIPAEKTELEKEVSAWSLYMYINRVSLTRAGFHIGC